MQAITMNMKRRDFSNNSAPFSLHSSVLMHFFRHISIIQDFRYGKSCVIPEKEVIESMAGFWIGGSVYSDA